MRLTIRSDGTPHGTEVRDEHGEFVHGVQRIVVVIDVSEPRATVTLTTTGLADLADLQFDESSETP